MRRSPRTALALLLPVALALAAMPRLARAQARPIFQLAAVLRPTFSWFHDPDGDVSVKEFAFFHNVVTHFDTTSTPDTTFIVPSVRQLFHIIYQRSGGLHIAERTLGHAWSPDLVH